MTLLLPYTVKHFMTYSFPLAEVWFCCTTLFALSAMKYTLKDEIVKKCLIMGITKLTNVIWGSKLSVLYSQISFYGFAVTPPLYRSNDHKTNNLTPPNDKFEYNYPLSYLWL